MQVGVSSNIAEVLGAARRLHPQFQFACASALTATVKAVQAEMPAELDRALDRPVEFTRRGFYVQAASKARLQASVGVKAKQAEYLGYQVEGGERAPARRALRLPTHIQLDSSGNIPRGLVAKLTAAARSGRRLGKRMARSAGLAQDASLFYGQPAGGLPVGIYRRELRGTRQVLVPLVVMPKQSARYRPRFDFYGIAQRTVERELEAQLDRAWAQALASARR